MSYYQGVVAPSCSLSEVVLTGFERYLMSLFAVAALYNCAEMF